MLISIWIQNSNALRSIRNRSLLIEAYMAIMQYRVLGKIMYERMPRLYYKFLRKGWKFLKLIWKFDDLKDILIVQYEISNEK